MAFAVVGSKVERIPCFGRGSASPTARLASIFLALILLGASCIAAIAAPQAREGIPAACHNARASGLPLPASLPPPDYQKLLYKFIAERRYESLGWCVDKGTGASPVRDTGPFVNSVHFGTHPSVRMYYSPEMMRWLTGDRSKAPADGAIVIKEMFKGPAARYDTANPGDMVRHLDAWTVMVRDSRLSRDGWYWANPGIQNVDPSSSDYQYTPIEAGAGLYCVRCHASARDFSTFSSLRNIRGFGGEPIRFRVDESWRELPLSLKPWPASGQTNLEAFIQHMPMAVSSAAPALSRGPGTDQPGSIFRQMFGRETLLAQGRVNVFPHSDMDRVVAGARRTAGFITADQCLGCHGGISGDRHTSFGPVMFIQKGPEYGDGYNVSPYGEWRWSPMGLAGRDPIFHAQLDSEIALIRKEFALTPQRAKELEAHLVNTCSSCHAAMGQRQLSEDAKRLKLNPLFRREYLYIGHDDWKNPYRKYGELGRDGISCAVCHRMQPVANKGGRPDLQNYLVHGVTGNFRLGPPDEIYGPYKNEEIVTAPMKNAIGITPKYNDYIKSSRLCGSCHTVNLPNLDQPRGEKPATLLDAGQTNPVFKPFKHSIEQATYLEWLNSAYQNEAPDKNPTPQHMKTCQGCHMPGNFQTSDRRIDLESIQTRIAAIQDTTYPEADHLLPARDLNVRLRNEGYSRHRFQGLNGLLVEMFRQSPAILGVRLQDYMTNANGTTLAMQEYLQQARERTVGVVIGDASAAGNELRFKVTVTNKTGHRFPSGVGFRRAFLEVIVRDEETGKVVWASGRTNSAGVILGSDGQPLTTEFFERGPDGKQQYQVHHQLITRQDQVQIYEEIITNAYGVINTSFLRRAHHIKDNRLLPLGWRMKGHDPDRYEELKAFVDATRPGPVANQDEDYLDGQGLDRTHFAIAIPPEFAGRKLAVQATMYYQSIPPSWLRERFETAPEMPATQRLFQIASTLNLRGTPVEDWKVRLASARASISAR